MTFQEQLEKFLSPGDLQRLYAWMGRMDPERQAEMMEFIAARETKAPAVGEDAPDFDLPLLGSSNRVRLSGYRDHLPVALIFGSYT